jgi:hypothetical protein
LCQTADLLFGPFYFIVSIGERVKLLQPLLLNHLYIIIKNSKQKNKKMKQFKLIVSSLFVLLAAGSCKKQNTALPVVDKAPKLAKIEYAGSTSVVTYSYNAQGRLSEVKDNSFTTKYDYTSATPVITSYYTSSGVKRKTISEMVLSNNRATQYNTHYFNSQGEETNNTPVNYEYDANGFQIKKSYPGYEYITEVISGNMTKQTIRDTNTGAVRTFTFDFYTNKPNKFNLNLLELWYDNYLADNSLFGTNNSSLIKRITYQSGIHTEVIDFSYVTNADGYVTEFTTATSKNGSTPVTSTAKLTYK